MMLNIILKRVFIGLIAVMCISNLIVGANDVNERVSFEPGKIHPEVPCSNSKYSYSLYLPVGYTADKKWPVIFFLEPAARSELPLKRFKEAADKYGYILVCSRQFQDGPYEENNRAMLATWQEIRQRYSIEPARCYASGFSGGARAATRLHVMEHKSLAGIIACGAGLDTRLKAAELSPASFIATIGLEDFNYKEMVKLEIQLQDAGIEHIILITQDDHRWPDESVCTRTVEWLELQAMKKGLLPIDKELVMNLYQKELNIAGQLETAGKLFQAARGFEMCETLFVGLCSTDEAGKGKKRVMDTGEYKTFQKNEIRRNKEEWEYISRFAFAAKKIETGPTKTSTVREIKKQMGILVLRKIIDKKKDIYDVYWAKRLLTEIYLKFNRAGSYYLEKGDYKRAVVYLELVISATRFNAPVHVELARAYSQEGNKKKALENLQIAIEKGFADSNAIRTDNAFDSLREDKEFKDILLKMQQKVLGKKGD